MGLWQGKLREVGEKHGMLQRVDSNMFRLVGNRTKCYQILTKLPCALDTQSINFLPYFYSLLPLSHKVLPNTNQIILCTRYTIINFLPYFYSLLSLSHKVLPNTNQMKALKCKPSAEFGGNVGIFGLKTPLHAYV